MSITRQKLSRISATARRVHEMSGHIASFTNCTNQTCREQREMLSTLARQINP